MNWSRISTILSGALAAGLMAGAAQAQIGRGDAPVQIESDNFEYLQNEGRGIYTGNVEATQSDSRITTDKLTVMCTKSAAVAGADPACEAIEQLVAEGNVLYVAPDIKIRGDRAQYDYAADTITITGDVISSRGTEGVVRGTQIVYLVGEGRVKVTAGSKRVTSYFTRTSPDKPATPPAKPAPAPRPN